MIESILQDNIYFDLKFTLSDIIFNIVSLENFIIADEDDSSEIILELVLMLTGFSTINFHMYSENLFLDSNFRITSLVQDDVRSSFINSIFNVCHKDRELMSNVLDEKTKCHLKKEINETLYDDLD